MKWGENRVHRDGAIKDKRAIRKPDLVIQLSTVVHMHARLLDEVPHISHVVQVRDENQPAEHNEDAPTKGHAEKYQAIRQLAILRLACWHRTEKRNDLSLKISRLSQTSVLTLFASILIVLS